MLVFQNTILSLVASIQVSSYDMIRVGDWIEMPALNSDGDVIDISLHTVTVQNWDKTVTTIPTHRLHNRTFKLARHVPRRRAAHQACPDDRPGERSLSV
jgi:miniconductance mechanosensitive channel